jgi:hypothetical protein
MAEVRKSKFLMGVILKAFSEHFLAVNSFSFQRSSRDTDARDSVFNFELPPEYMQFQLMHFCQAACGIEFSLG